jgi:hypothetical protein
MLVVKLKVVAARSIAGLYVEPAPSKTAVAIVCPLPVLVIATPTVRGLARKFDVAPEAVTPVGVWFCSAA